MTPPSDQAVPDGGSLCWYLAAPSADRRHGITLIAFVGSVFSPYYAWARKAGRPTAENHCAVNVALYGDGGKRWALTERGRGDLHRTPTTLTVGPSALEWTGTSLDIRVDERTFPLPGRIRGRIRVHPRAMPTETYSLDGEGRHRWRPIAPGARIEVELDRPDLSWQGEGYLDSNAGDEPLENGFVRWDWSRGCPNPGETVIYYDVTRKGGEPYNLAVRCDAKGRATELEPPRRVTLPGTLWGIPRATRVDETLPVRVDSTLEDTPFYARSLLSTFLLGKATPAIHESLSLERFRSPIVQWMLPFRMPRRATA